MPDWKKSMQQTFEYYIVDPGTWRDKERIHSVEPGSTISWDSTADTLGSAVINVIDTLDECYLRIYLVTSQNGVTEKFPLATVLVQTPTFDFDGKVRKASMDAYTPLLELKEKLPPLGYSLFKNDNIMEAVCRIVRDNVRAPVVTILNSENLEGDFVADPSETWLAYTKALMANAKYSFGLDELGRILFVPDQDTASLQPVWTYDDSNSSILYPEITLDRDLFDIPNVVEVSYSDESDSMYARAVNDDSNSPVSTVGRGREIVYRETNPSINGIPTQDQLDKYAEQLLRDMSSVEYTLSYTHGYCPVRVGDCVRLNYARAGLTDIKAKVISQSIKCEPGIPVTEKAVFTTKLWR